MTGNLAISNIAWKLSEEDAVFGLLQDYGVRGLEIAPPLAFPDEADPFAPSEAALSAFMRKLDRRRIELVSMQSLLFGVQDASLFGSESQCGRFKQGLERAAGLARRLGIRNLVMGSPANRRIPDSLSRRDAEHLALGVLREIGDKCLGAGSQLALEPNPAVYGTNFLITIGETVEFVQKADHPAVSVNFDIGSLHLNGEMEAAAEWFAKCRPFVSHVHISEPHLGPAPRDIQQFQALAGSILANGYTGWFSIEMRAVGDDNLSCVREAVSACSRALNAVTV